MTNFKKSIFTLLLALFTTLSFITSAYAAHIVGGSLRYKEKSRSGNTVTYTITMKMYRDFAAQTQLTGTETLGIYLEDTLTKTSKKLYQNRTFDLPRISLNKITKPQPPGCTIVDKDSVEEGVYQADITLDVNTQGYHVVFSRCCRGTTVINMEQNPAQAIGLYTFISPADLANNGAYYVQPPTPSICAGDSTIFNNTAADLDGDKLIYRLAQPFNGYTTSGGPGGTPPNPINWPIALVQYAGGYSLSQPFGAGGYARIDSLTGETVVFPPNQGNYAIGIDVYEYRNGKQIAVTRRDLTLYAKTCQVQPPIKFTTSTGSNTFTVEGGDKLCFDFTYENEVVTDSVYVTTGGNVFTLNPPAIATGPDKAIGKLTKQICWTTSCTQANPNPYTIKVSARNNACPPKYEFTTLNIFVTSPAPLVAGRQSVCPKMKGQAYNVTNVNPNSTYKWVVKGGKFTPPAAPATNITVDWDTTKGAVVSVIETNKFGCQATYNFLVAIDSMQTISVGADQTVCSGDSTAKLGPVSPGPGVYKWTMVDGSPLVGMKTATNPNPKVALTNNTGTDILLNYNLLYRTADYCVGSNSVKVTTYQKPLADAGPVSREVCDNADNVIGTAPKTGHTYTWSPNTNLTNASTAQPVFNKAYDPIGPNTFKYVVEANYNGCKAKDSINLTIRKGPTVTTTASADSVCPGSTVTLKAKGAVTYIWLDNTLTKIDSGQTTAVVVNATAAYYAKGFDDIGCADTNKIMVATRAYPAIKIAPAGLSVCLNDTAKLTSSGGVSYKWYDNTNNFLSSSPKYSFKILTPTKIKLIGVDSKGCMNADSINIQTKALPVITASLNPPGKDTVCAGTAISLTGSGGDSYKWYNVSYPNIILSNSNIYGASGTAPYKIVVKGTDATTGCSGTDTIPLYFRISPNVYAVAQKDSICSGDKITLDANGALQYQWYKLPNTTTPVSSLNKYTENLSSSTSYKLVGVDKFGCSNQAQINIFVRSLPNLKTFSTPDSVCPGKPSKVTVQGANSYIWNIKDSVATYSVDSFFTVKPLSSVTFTVKGTDKYGCANVGIAKVGTFAKPAPRSVIGSSYACPGLRKSKYYAVNTTAPGYIVKWYITGGTPPQAFNKDTIYVDWGNALGTGKIVMLEESNRGCVSDTNQALVKIDDKLSPPAPTGLNTLCSRDGINMKYISLNPSPGASFTWTVEGGTILSGQGTDSIRIKWTSIGDNVGKIFFLERDQTPTAQCTGFSDTLVVTINPSPTAMKILGDTSVCIGDERIQYNLNGFGPSIYKWKIGGTTPFTGDGKRDIYADWKVIGKFPIAVLETTDRGCLGDTIKQNIYVNALPVGTEIFGADTICAASLKGQVYQAFANGGKYYKWDVVGGRLTAGQDSAKATIDWDRAAAKYQISFSPLSKDSCLGLAITKEVYGDFAKASIVNTSTKFEGDSIVELAWEKSFRAGKLNSYELFRRVRGSGLAYKSIAKVNTNSYTDKDPSLNTDANAYEYIYSIIDECGDTSKSTHHNTILLNGTGDQSTQNVSLRWNPYLNWKYNLQRYEVWRKVDNEQDYKFIAAAGTDTSITLNTGADGFKHLYRIKAIENTTNGVSWSNDRVIYFDQLIKVPTAFSPNGDGVNDTWVIGNVEAYKGAQIEVFNRWGQKVFVSTGYNNDWKGTSNDEDLPDGTYFYVIKLNKKSKNAQESITGNVTIIR